MEPQVIRIEFSLKKVIQKLGNFFVQFSDHSDLPLFIVLTHKEIDLLKDAEPVGLEVNLGGLGAFFSPDAERRGRRGPKVDLLFKRGNTYYVIEVTDKRKNIKKAERQVRDYAKLLRDSDILLGPSRSVEIIPVVVYTQERDPTQAQSEMFGLIQKN